MAVIAGTGHRPNKLGGYSTDAFKNLCHIAQEVLKELKPKLVISGMALGWDQALACAAIAENIPFAAAIPFEGQQNAWPESSRMIYSTILEKSAKKIIVCDGGYAAWKMQKRNEWMVDHADTIVALWDGSIGGTANCINYAKKIGKKIINYWDKYENSKSGSSY